MKTKFGRKKITRIEKSRYLLRHLSIDVENNESILTKSLGSNKYKINLMKSSGTITFLLNEASLDLFIFSNNDNILER